MPWQKGGIFETHDTKKVIIELWRHQIQVVKEQMELSRTLVLKNAENQQNNTKFRFRSACAGCKAEPLFVCLFGVLRRINSISVI